MRRESNKLIEMASSLSHEEQTKYLDSKKSTIPEPCDHEWETIDDSFSHEFGTEVIIYSQCKNCDARTQIGYPVNKQD